MRTGTKRWTLTTGELWVSLALALMLFLPLTVAAASPAQAGGGANGWSDCTWQNRSPADTRVRVNSANTFPPSTVQDGVTNSFTNRVSDAVNAWDGTMAANGIAQGVNYVSSGSAAEITIQYEQRNGQAFGITFTNSNCTIHRRANVFMASTDIFITPRGDWFTQDNSRRALWEACPTQGGPAYTCSKVFDFGSTMTHELGHAVGWQYHPSNVDAHDGNQDAFGIAQCANIPSRATMCPIAGGDGPTSNGDYRTERRTTHPWDSATINEHYFVHGG